MKHYCQSFICLILACKGITLFSYVNQFSLSSFSWFFPVLLVCTWRYGGHIGDQEQKHFSPLGTKQHFHVNSSRTNSTGHFRVPKPSPSKWGQVHNLSCEKELICMRMKNHFHIKGWALNLVLIQRPGGTRKWPIVLTPNMASLSRGGKPRIRELTVYSTFCRPSLHMKPGAVYGLLRS